MVKLPGGTITINGWVNEAKGTLGCGPRMEQTESSSFRMSEGVGLWERTKGHCGLTATRARLGRGMAEIIATRTPARPRGVKQRSL
jgi:hypothetical protein